jgi:ATP-binding cassette subfamily B protein
VDHTTETAILKNLKEQLINKTSIVISHRVSSVLEADKIIILDEGKIIEQGTVKELLNKEGYFKDLFHKQA